MTTAKMQFGERGFFDLVKGYINPHRYVECAVCGAVETEGRELVRVIHETSDEALCDLPLEYLPKLLDEPSDEDYKKWLNYEEWLKFEAANKHRFFIDDDYGEGTCIKYDKIVLFCDPACDCFGKNKIKNTI